jgi:predicted aspartyl protease
VIALVNAESPYSVMPAPLLQMLGLDPEWTWVFELPDGGQEERPVAEVQFRLNNQERTTICIFGKPESGPILGAYTLESFGLAADPVSRKLVPARLFLVW